MLTQEQLCFFSTFGYLVLPQAIRADIGWITKEFESVWASYPDVVHDGSQRTIFPKSFITTSRRLSSLIEDSVGTRVLDDLFGPGWSSYGGDGNFYSGDTAWHSDSGVSADKTITPHIKLAFYLDHLTRETGALRVIPGSHHWNDAYWRLLEENVGSGKLGVHGRDIPSVAVEVSPGDLVVFDHRIKHSSFGGGKRRRMFTINNFAPCHTEDQREAARAVLRCYRNDAKVDWQRREGWIDWIETLSPAGQSHFSQTLRLGADVMSELAVVA